MKIKFKYIALWLIMISPIIGTSCGDDFLEVSDPLIMSEGIFPSEVEDLEPILVDIYGRMLEGYYGGYMRMWNMIDHSTDHGYNGAQYNEFGLNELNPNLSNVSNVWLRHYLAIGKCNDLLEAVETIRDKGDHTAAELETLDQYEGQARFLRAFYYYPLINLYGEYPILAETDKSKMGVPLWDYVPVLISETYKGRATQGEIWEFMISDLQAAESLLEGVEFSENARVNEWAVKSLLGKCYIFTLQWTEARDVLKEVIDNSGKELVSYDVMRDMFNGNNEFNSESIFEVSATPDPLGGSSKENTGTNWMRGISVSYIDGNGVEQTNGFGNLFIHDMNIPRYGFDYDATTAAEQKDPAYIAYSELVRLDKSVDPRLFVSTLQPYVDSIPFVGVWRTVAKNRVESYNADGARAWCNHKYNVLDHYWADNNAWEGINMYALRLADVYLLYAEAQMHLGQEVIALEYINKVHRRAYDQPVDVPSPYDYATLSDRTKTLDPTDALANDPLKYERWAEFLGEAGWWFDVRRFDLGAEEASYYGKVMGGTLEWRDTKYALPIPTAEIDANAQMVPNPGY